MTHHTLDSKSYSTPSSSFLAVLRDLFMATPAYIFIVAARKALAR